MATPLTKRPVLHLPLSPAEWIIEVVAWIGLLSTILIPFLYRPALPDPLKNYYNAAGGPPDGWGDTGPLFTMVGISVLIYLGMTLLNRFPHIYNYPFNLTEENVESQYRCARMLTSTLKAEFAWFFAYLEWRTIQMAFGKVHGLDSGFLPVLLICLIGTVIIFSYRARKL